MPGTLAVELSHEWAVGVSYQQYCWVIHLYIPLTALMRLHADGSSTLPVIFLTLEACTVGRRRGLEYTANCMWRPLSAASESKHIRSKNCIKKMVLVQAWAPRPPSGKCVRFCDGFEKALWLSRQVKFFNNRTEICSIKFGIWKRTESQLCPNTQYQLISNDVYLWIWKEENCRETSHKLCKRGSA